MRTFHTLQKSTNIQELIKETFDADLPIAGDWGYSKDSASILTALPHGMPLLQLQHTLTTIRAHLEMDITQEKNHRYSAINANEISREAQQLNGLNYQKVTYKVTAIKADLFKKFIGEYKNGYEKESFDLNAHFKKREAATLTREVVHYFEISQII
ncbi:MAG: hypothetical protein Q9M39_06655 [Sulfurovum sp.]|nr:hypothetical protein [Sulfurovum sp.]